MQKHTQKHTLKSSFAHAARGLFGALWAERNMRIHAVAAVYVLFFAPFLGVSRGEYGVLLACCGLVFGLECVNTAVEALCDALHPGWSGRIGFVKDAAAGAVLFGAIFAAAAGLVILWRWDRLLALAQTILGHPLYCILFVLSLVLAVVFVCTAPGREKADKPSPKNKET